MVIDKIDLITRTNLFSLFCFNFAVDANQTVGDGLFGMTTALGEAFKFQYFVEFYEFGFEFGYDIVGIAHMTSDGWLLPL